MFSMCTTTKHQSMTRLLLLAAVLLACLAWPCSAEAETAEPQETEHDTTATLKAGRYSMTRTRPRIRHPTVFFASDIPETLLLTKVAQQKLILAKSAGDLAKSTANTDSSKTPFDITAELLKSRTRAETAKQALDTTNNKDASYMAKMVAAVAKELYENDTAVELPAKEHMQWFEQRYANATAQETKMKEAITVLQKTEKEHHGIHPIITAVLFPARNINKLAQDAENDAKRVVYKRVATQMLAERIENLHAFANTQATAETSCTKEDSVNKNSVPSDGSIATHRDAAAKAYLSAASAQKIAAICVGRINANATQVETTYYALRELLAKIQGTDYDAVRVYQNIADEAHANAEESKEIAAGTPSDAEEFVKTAKAHLDGITSCVNVTEAKWRANEARKASLKALNEMHYALYHLSSVTVSLQQVADAKKAVDASEALKNALDSEKKFNETPKTVKAENKKETVKPEDTTTTAPAKEGETTAEQKPTLDGKTGPQKRIVKEKSEEEMKQEKAENDAAMREAKKKAVESEKEAETSYGAVKAHADKAADAVQHVEHVVKQAKDLAAQVPQDKKTNIETQLTKAKTALQTAKTQNNAAQTAAATVFSEYNKTKTAADSALQEFEKNIVEHLQTTATTNAKATESAKTTEEVKAKNALEEVEKQKTEASAAYSEVLKLVEALGKKDGFDTLKVKSDKPGDRDSATAFSPLRLSVAVLCVMAVSMLCAA